MSWKRMTPAQEASYALDHGVARKSLSPAAQAEYDRQLVQRRAAASPAAERGTAMERGPSGRDPDMPTYEELREAERQSRRDQEWLAQRYREKDKRYKQRHGRG